MTDLERAADLIGRLHLRLQDQRPRLPDNTIVVGPAFSTEIIRAILMNSHNDAAGPAFAASEGRVEPNDLHVLPEARDRPPMDEVRAKLEKG